MSASAAVFSMRCSTLCQPNVRFVPVQRTARLFAIAEALRARRTGVTAESLADTFGVSVRTMYRDLDSLREASLPVAEGN